MDQIPTLSDLSRRHVRFSDKLLDWCSVAEAFNINDEDGDASPDRVEQLGAAVGYVLETCSEEELQQVLGYLQFDFPVTVGDVDGSIIEMALDHHHTRWVVPEGVSEHSPTWTIRCSVCGEERQILRP